MVNWKTSFISGRNEKGLVLVVVVLLMSLLALLSTTSELSSRTGLRLSSNYKLSQEVLYIAQGGAEYGLNRLRATLNVSGGGTSSVVPPTIAGFTFENTGSFLALSGGVVQKTVTGQFAGLTANCQRYIITSSVVKDNTNARATVVYEVEDQLIPLFQFGDFFDHDMEILPGSSMTFNAAGPIHSNNDIYLNASMNIDSKITAFGNIILDRKDSSTGATGTVRIKDAGGAYQTLTIASSTATWRGDAEATWNGRVHTGAHDIQSLNMTLPAGGNPIDLLGTGSTSLFAKSGLRIYQTGTGTTGTTFIARNKDGATVTLPAGLVSRKIFWDWREGVYMYAVGVNLLNLTGAALTALNNPPVGGQAGLLYISSVATNAAVRLENGANLPAGLAASGLSVVTNNPLYILGDFNTGNLPAGIFADAVTVLSANWVNTENGFLTDNVIDPAQGWRTANPSTTVRAAIMAGNEDTVGGQYSGGVENYIRLLENWTGKTLTLSGSLTCLWQSQYATGNWQDGGNLYRPPTRNFSYISFANQPPGTPSVRSVQRISSKQVLN